MPYSVSIMLKFIFFLSGVTAGTCWINSDDLRRD